MPGVKVRDGESIDKALRAFKRQVERAGIKTDLKKHEFYEKPSVRKKKKTLAARKRMVKQMKKLGG